MGRMRMLNSLGDSTVNWSADDPTSLSVAEHCFNQERDHRHLAFARPDGATAEEATRIYAFDPRRG